MKRWRQERAWRGLWIVSGVVAVILLYLVLRDPLYYVVVRNCQWTRRCIPENMLTSPDPRIGIIMSYETDHYAQLGRLAEEDKRLYAERHG